MGLPPHNLPTDDGGGGGGETWQPAPLRPDTEPFTAVYYVSTSGSDETGTGTVRNPFRSLRKALRDSIGGELILIEPGNYGELVESTARPGQVTVRAARSQLPRVAGARILGGQGIRFQHIRFTEQVQISQHGVLGGSQRGSNITIEASELTTNGGRSCFRVRTLSHDVRLIRSYVHDCQHGVSGPGYTSHSSNITIRDNLLEDFWADGIAFGHWRDVVIEGNTIRNMFLKPNSNEHNDGIQIFGDSERVTIENNHIHDSDGQLLLIQDPIVAGNDDILVRNNLIHGSGAYAIQVLGSTDVRFVNNTVWDSRYGALLIRKGSTGVIPTDAVVVNNILKSYTTLDGARAAVRRNNLIMTPPAGGAAEGEIVGQDPGFVDAEAGDFRLSPSSPARGAGVADWAPAVDLRGISRPTTPSLGPLE